MKFLFYILLSTSVFLQQRDRLVSVELGDHRSAYMNQVNFYTGDEAFYQNNPTIRALLLRNIDLGIMEGVTDHPDYTRFGDFQATRANLLFYQDSLYKATWTFEYSTEYKIPALTESIDQLLTEKFGTPKIDDFGFVVKKVWDDKNGRWQTFKEGRAVLTIEIRDEAVHQKVEALKAN